MQPILTEFFLTAGYYNSVCSCMVHKTGATFCCYQINMGWLINFIDLHISDTENVSHFLSPIYF